MPRIIPAAEWRHLETGLVQRVTAPARLIGPLHSRLRYGDAASIGMDSTLVALLDQVLGDLARAHDAIEALYFRA